MTQASQPTTPAADAPAPSRAKWGIGRILLILAGIFALAFLGIQLIPVQRDNPPVASHINWDSPQTQALFTRACADCHSNETVWPWYSYVAPTSWMVSFDVNRGRRQWNLSAYGVPPQQQNRSASQPSGLAAILGAFLSGERRPGQFAEGGERRPPNGGFGGDFGGGAQASRLGGRITEAVQSGQMPPANYILLHPAASLTQAEQQQLIQGLIATLQQSAPTAAQNGS